MNEIYRVNNTGCDKGKQMDEVLAEWLECVYMGRRIVGKQSDVTLTCTVELTPWPCTAHLHQQTQSYQNNFIHVNSIIQNRKIFSCLGSVTKKKCWNLPANVDWSYSGLSMSILSKEPVEYTEVISEILFMQLRSHSAVKNNSDRQFNAYPSSLHNGYQLSGRAKWRGTVGAWEICRMSNRDW